jgi:hypothetical protein
VGILRDLLTGGTLDRWVERARKALHAGNFDEALEIVDKGLKRWPDAQILSDTGHQVRRAQASAAIQALQSRIEQDGEPAAFEELIALYREVGMPAEMTRLTERYVREHADLETAHLLRAEQALDAFFDDLRARDGRTAIDHLVRAALLQPDAVRPRTLLAEVYFAIGADRALLSQADTIERLSGGDEVLASAVGAMREAADPAAKPESVDALLARVEVAGQVLRDPSSWSSRPRRGMANEADAERVRRGLARLVGEGAATEAVAIDRAGSLLASVGTDAPCPPAAEGAPGAAEAETALAGVARAVARTVKPQVRELELGRFRRCVGEGSFGVMVVADAAGGVVAGLARRGSDPLRLEERLSVAVAGGRGRHAS